MAKYGLCSLLFFCVLWDSFAQGVDQEAIGKEPRYHTWPKIGQGTYGDVRWSGDHAVKIGVLRDETQCSRNILEAAIYRALKNPSMPTVLSINIHRGKFDNFLEIHMTFCKPCKADHFPDVLEQVAELLRCAHANNIAHRDIKKQHFMRHDTLMVLIDWGMADIFTASPMERRGTTLGYCSPEVLLSHFANPKENDMWSFGVSLLELANGVECMFPQNHALHILNSFFVDAVDNKISLKSLNDSCKNGHQKLSDKLLKPMEKITNPSQKKSIKGMLEPVFAERISAQQILPNPDAASQISSIAPLPQPIFRENSQVNERMREMTYLWLYELTVEFKHPGKFLFEAMSMTDRFIGTSDLTKDNLQLTAAIAYYLAEDFYDDGHTIGVFVNYAARAFSKEQFRDFMLTLLENADFNLIFNHPLRAYQRQIYQGNMPPHNSGMAIFLLTMLEISTKTYSKPNHEKWQLVEAVLNHLKESASISDENRSAWHAICRHFAKSVLAQNSYYLELCKSAQ